jgi:hypothetical protein
MSNLLALLVAAVVGLYAAVAYAACPTGSLDVTASPYNAVVDDEAADRTAIMAAQTACPATGCTICFPPGEYNLTSTALILEKSRVKWYCEPGAIINRKSSDAHTFQTSGSFTNLTDITVEGCYFNRDVGGNQIALDLGDGISNVKVIGNTFDGMVYAVLGDGASDILIAGNACSDDGGFAGHCFQLGGTFARATVRENTIRCTDDGITISAPTDPATATDILIEGNDLDLCWYTGKASRTGVAESFTTTSLDDTAAGFTANAFGANATHTIRVLVVRETGTGATVTYPVSGGKPRIVDTAATFAALGVIPGEIVRVSGKFGIVESVDAETILTLEEWLDSTTYAVTSAPAATTEYTAYRVILGHLSSTIDDDTLSVNFSSSAGWFDLVGTHAIDPPDNSIYEVLLAHGNYPIQLEPATQRSTIRNNRVRRGWSDQISAFGDENVITGNDISRGQDMGVTVHGTGLLTSPNTVADNTITWQGVSCVYVGATGSYSSVVGNRCSDWQWVNQANANAGGIFAETGAAGSNGLLIADNRLRDSAVLATTTNGIALRAITGAQVTVVTGNAVVGVSGTAYKSSTATGGTVSALAWGNSGNF